MYEGTSIVCNEFFKHLFKMGNRCLIKRFQNPAKAHKRLARTEGHAKSVELPEGLIFI